MRRRRASARFLSFLMASISLKLDSMSCWISSMPGNQPPSGRTKLILFDDEMSIPLVSMLSAIVWSVHTTSPSLGLSSGTEISTEPSSSPTVTTGSLLRTAPFGKLPKTSSACSLYSWFIGCEPPFSVRKQALMLWPPESMQLLDNNNRFLRLKLALRLTHASRALFAIKFVL